MISAAFRAVFATSPLSLGRNRLVVAGSRQICTNYVLYASPSSGGGGGSGGGGSPSSASLSGTAKAKLEKEKRAKKRRSKNLQIRVRSGPTFHIDEALRLVRSCATAAFDETVDFQIQLSVDPRKPNQNIRGIAQLPYGTGKALSIAVFARGEKAEEARRAGATIVGAEDLVERISKGDLNFTKTIATPDMMPLVGKIARILGPRGLMPNPKLGTVTLAIKEAVSAAKRGQAEFRTEKRGLIMSGVGKVSFPLHDLKENAKAFLLAVGDTRPEGVKGTYMKAAYLKSTMGPGIPLDVSILDPASSRFWEAAAPAPVLSATTSTSSAAVVAGGAEGAVSKPL